MTVAAERPDFERVLTEHEDYGLYSDAGGDTHYVCACDKVKRSGSHHAHLAAALNAEVARWLTDEVAELRAGAALRLPHLSGENAATVRGWVAACDEVAALASTDTTADEKGAGR